MTNRLVLAIAIPMTLAYLSTPILGIVDTAVVGQLGVPALLGGLAIGAIIFDLVFTTFNFLRSGTTGLVAQAYGAADGEEEQAVFWRALAVAAIGGIAITMTSPLIIVAGQWFMAAGQAVSAAMASYVTIRAMAAPFSLGNYVLLGYVLGRGEGTLGLALQIVLNATNIALSIYLGLHLGWGIEGVAWATVCAEIIAFLVGIAFVLVRFSRLPNPNRAKLFDLRAIRRMLTVNRDIMMRSFILLAAFALFTRAGAEQGEVILAANAVLMNFFLIAGFFLDGFATAAEQLTGRAVGARHRPAFVDAVRLTLLWGSGLALILTAIMMLAGEPLVALMTASAQVRIVAAAFIPWAAFTAVAGIVAFQMDGVFIGATWSRDMRNMMLISFLVYVLALFLLGEVWGNHGIWAALLIFLLVRGATLLAIYPTRLNGEFADM